MSADKITAGTWSSRWGDWVVGLHEKDAEWAVSVWRWTRGGGVEEREQLDTQDGFMSPSEAVMWACDVLRACGARTFVIDRPSITLEMLLRFSPVPEGLV